MQNNQATGKAPTAAIKASTAKAAGAKAAGKAPTAKAAGSGSTAAGGGSTEKTSEGATKPHIEKGKRATVQESDVDSNHDDGTSQSDVPLVQVVKTKGKQKKAENIPEYDSESASNYSETENKKKIIKPRKPKVPVTNPKKKILGVDIKKYQEHKHGDSSNAQVKDTELRKLDNDAFLGYALLSLVDLKMADS